MGKDGERDAQEKKKTKEMYVQGRGEIELLPAELICLSRYLAHVSLCLPFPYNVANAGILQRET